MSSLSLRERLVRSAWRMTPQRALSEIIGWGARRSLPRGVRAHLLRSFAQSYGIDVNEAEKPLEEYLGLNDFFARKLRLGARPIDMAEDAVVMPADGRLVEMAAIGEGTIVDAKCSSFTVAELLGDKAEGARFEGGSYAIIYLSPRDYHRVHSPVAGNITGWAHIPGHLFPVNERSVAREPALFSRNERFVTFLESEAGPAAVVMVAAVGVGHVTASFDAEVGTHTERFSTGELSRKHFSAKCTLERGGEIGTFNLGSTAIVVFAKGAVELDRAHLGKPTRMGQRLGRNLKPTAFPWGDA